MDIWCTFGLETDLLEECGLVIVVDEVAAPVLDLDDDGVQRSLLGGHDLDVEQGGQGETLGEGQVGGGAGYLEQLGQRAAELEGLCAQTTHVTHLTQSELNPTDSRTVEYESVHNNT